MSGHSKWHNIQAKKGKADAAKGRIFTKLGREIAVAAKNNPNPDTNSKLADIIAKAKAANMPNDNIQRSIKKASGELNGADYKELLADGLHSSASQIKAYLGDFVAVVMTDKAQTCGLVKPKSPRLFEVVYYTVTVEKGKIVDIQGCSHA